MPMPRHGIAGAVIGNEFHLASGMIQSAGALSFLDPRLEVHTGQHDVLELNFFFPTPPASAKKEEAPASTGAKAVGGAPSSAAVNNVSVTSSSARLKNVSAISIEGANSLGAASSGGKKPYMLLQREQPRRPGDAREICEGGRDRVDLAGFPISIHGLGSGIPIGSRATRLRCGISR